MDFVRKAGLIWFVLVILNLSTSAQVTRLGENVLELSGFIGSEYFGNLQVSDLDLVDTLYLKALEITNNDISEAVLALTFTAIPYQEVPVIFPIFKFRINIPLVSANDSIFRKKNLNLPKNLLYDSPKNDFGDKDKIAHFFGNAFLAYNMQIFDFTKFLGIFVEDFEEKFKVEASVDPRDLEVNYLGYLFGKAVKKDKNILPSQIFLSYYILKKSAYEFGFCYRR